MSLPLANFDCEGDPVDVAIRWKRWKEDCRDYLHSQSIDEPYRKKAMLLQMGGLPLQDIYYNKTSPIEPRMRNFYDVFETALQKLDTYFNPKNNILYERYVFRSMEQDSREIFMRFLERLKQQSVKCNFRDPDAQIIEQIIQKCASNQLKDKILAMGDGATLHKIISVSEANEVTRRPSICPYNCRKRRIDISESFYEPDCMYHSSSCETDEDKCCTCRDMLSMTVSRPLLNHSVGDNNIVVGTKKIKIERNISVDSKHFKIEHNISVDTKDIKIKRIKEE